MIEYGFYGFVPSSIENYKAYGYDPFGCYLVKGKLGYRIVKR